MTASVVEGNSSSGPATTDQERAQVPYLIGPARLARYFFHDCDLLV